MTPQTAMVFNLLVFVVVHHLRLEIVIMTLAAADQVRFAFLNGEMTVPAGSSLIVVDNLLMAIAALSTVKFFEFTMLEIFWFVVVVTLPAGYRLSGAIERVMTSGTGIGPLTVCTVIKENVAGTAFQVIPVGRNRFFSDQAAYNGNARRDQQGNGHR